MHPFVCLACGKGFKYEHSLNFHIKSYHGLGSGSNTATSMSSTSSSSNPNSNDVTSTVIKTRNRSLTSSPPLLPLSSSSLRVKCKTEECLETPHHLEDGLVIDKKAEHFSASTASPTFKEEKQRLERNRVRYENTSEGGSHVSDNTSDPCDLRIPSASAVNDVVGNTGAGGASSEGMSSSSSSESLSQTDFGFPAKVVSKGIEIKTEKALISVMEGVHTQSDQTYVLYKCCLCGYAFPCLEPMLSHMQSNHFNQSSLTCEKCGASFRWKSELQLHEQLHRAMDHQQQQGHQMVFPTVTSDASSSSINSSKSSSIASLSNSNNNNNNAKHSGASLQSLSSSFPTPFSNLVLFPHPFLSSAGDKFAMESLVNADNLNILSNLMNKANGINIQDNNNGRSTRSRNNFINKKNSDSHVNERMDCTFSDQALNLSSSSRNLVKQPSSQEQDSSHMKRTHPHQELIDYRTRGGRRSSSPSSSLERTSKLMKLQGSMNHHHPSVTIPSQDALMISKANPAPVVSGEIEEIAPGQFKCRYCDKTFDRVFSVHRHERVHTGFKPCICKVCGRGFSEKRNLRHHIIRFHSDGSGRELLKRARKDKALAASAKHLAASVMIGDHAFPIDVRVPLNNHSPQNQSLGYSLPTSQSNHRLQPQKQGSSSSSSPGIAVGSPDTNDHKAENERDSGEKNRHHLDNKQDSNNRSWREESDDDDESLMITSDDRNDDHHSLLSQSPRESQAVLHVSDKKSGHNDRDDDTREVSSMERDSPPSTSSSSRRRKGKPSKKILVNNCHATEDEEEVTPGEEDDEKRNKEVKHHQGGEEEEEEEERDGNWDDDHARVQSDKKSVSQENQQFPDEDMTEDEEEPGLEIITNDRPVSRSKSDGNFSETDSNSNGGNHSENSLEISLNSGNGNSKGSKGHGAFFSSYSPR